MVKVKVRRVGFVHKNPLSSIYCDWDDDDLDCSILLGVNHPKVDIGHPEKIYGWYWETPFYYNGPTTPGEAAEYTAIFTNRTAILERIPNAHVAPPMDPPMYGNYTYGDLCYIFGGEISDTLWERKTKNVSMVCTNKSTMRAHAFRQHVFFDAQKTQLIDAYGQLFGQEFIDNTEFGKTVYEPYMFNLCIENDFNDYYFTEKITSCFLSQTIPIYIGAKKIGDWYNTDGIIQLQPNEIWRIPAILKNACRELYMEMLPAVLDNYRRVRTYPLRWDYVWQTYLLKN